MAAPFERPERAGFALSDNTPLAHLEAPEVQDVQRPVRWPEAHVDRTGKRTGEHRVQAPVGWVDPRHPTSDVWAGWRGHRRFIPEQRDEQLTGPGALRWRHRVMVG